MKRLSLLPVLMALTMFAPRAFAALSEKGVEDRIIVAFKTGTPLAEQKEIASANGLEVIDQIPALAVLLVKAPSGLAADARVRLKTNPQILRADPDVWRQWIEVAPASVYQTPFPTVESALQTLPKPSAAKFAAARAKADEVQWGVARVNAPAAWAANQGAGVKVAVIDTGIDPEHAEFKGRIGGGINAIDEKAPWADDHAHGTHVAGIIAAALDGQGVVGVAPKATLYSVKVLTKEGQGNLFAIMKGISWCGENGIQVANMSLGAAQEMPMLQFALRSAVSAGVTFIAAAGNDGKAVNWPAAYPETIAVSASCPIGITEAKLCPSASEGIATFSSRGPQVAFIAPGVKIPSSVPVWHDASGIKMYSGTSMATPHVAGLAALAVARGARGVDAVRAALKAAAEPMNGLSPTEQGSGLINAAKLAR